MATTRPRSTRKDDRPTPASYRAALAHAERRLLECVTPEASALYQTAAHFAGVHQLTLTQGKEGIVALIVHYLLAALVEIDRTGRYSEAKLQSVPSFLLGEISHDVVVLFERLRAQVLADVEAVQAEEDVRS